LADMRDRSAVPTRPASTPVDAAAEVPLWVDEHTASALPTATGAPLWVADLPDAGWYPDPLDTTRVRYWGGFVWHAASMPILVPLAGPPWGDVRGDVRAGARAAERFPAPGGRSDTKRGPVRAALFSAFAGEGAGGVPAPRDPGPASLAPPQNR
jgi:hypothetical protein